jgi:hypothetical protein
MSELRIRCTVTRYSADYSRDMNERPQGSLVERTTEETTSAEVRGEYLYLGNSAASAPWKKLLAAAREGRGWDAQAGSPPVYVEGAGWGGRNYPKIRVEADALLELAVSLSSDEDLAQLAALGSHNANREIARRAR